MSSIAHLPATSWAATHRALSLVLAMVLMAATVTLAVVLLTRDTSSGSPAVPNLPAYDDTCASAMVGDPC